MMRFARLIVLLVSACASPSPGFFGAARHDVTLQGIRFAVFHQGNRAQVIRLGYLTPRQRAQVPDLMRQAAEKASGCRAIPGSLITRLPGDTGEARLALDCG